MNFQNIIASLKRNISVMEAMYDRTCIAKYRTAAIHSRDTLFLAMKASRKYPAYDPTLRFSPVRGVMRFSGGVWEVIDSIEALKAWH